MLNLFQPRLKKDWEAFERWWTFGEPERCLFDAFVSEDVTDKRLDVTSVIPLLVPFKIVQERLDC